MTTNEEKVLLERFGRENPFRVPEGYFDTLPEKVMLRLPRKRRKSNLWLKWSVAAILVGCVGLATFRMYDSPAGPSALVGQDATDEEYIEDALNYSMINNLEIATYLTEAD